MYPLIQTHVWAKIGREKDLLRRVLASFIRMGIANGLGSKRVEVLADTVVTLEQGTEGLVATEVIKKLLKVWVWGSWGVDMLLGVLRLNCMICM